MKKNLIKKVFAVSLSIAMACSFLPAANPVTASAAAPFVTLKTTFKTLKVNQSYKMTLKNNTINWKIKKVETTAKSIATVYGKTTSQVMIKGKSEGRATIRVRVATTKRKTNNTKTLRCRVKVVPATTVTDPTTPVQTDATVTTQAELDAALNNSSITKITIRPTTAVNFEIKSGQYANVDLIVDAPQSDIVNNAKFKSITINDIKAETWTENATGNSFTLLAKAVRLIVSRTATVSNISIGTADSKVNLVVNGGTVSNISANAKTALTITGEAAANAALIPVAFSAAAANSTFVTELPAAVSMSASIELTFQAGAVKSTVKLETTNIKATITNNTAEAIVVTKNDGKTTQSVRAGAQKTESNSVSTGTTTPTYPGTSGGSSSGSSSSKPATLYKINTGSAMHVTVSGSAYGTSETISSGSLTLGIDYVTVTAPGLTVEQVNAARVPVSYSIRASQPAVGGGTYSTTIASGDFSYTYLNGDKLTYRASYITAPINGFRTGEDITLTISVYVKETDQYAASVSAQGVYTKKINFAEANADAPSTILSDAMIDIQ